MPNSNKASVLHRFVCNRGPAFVFVFVLVFGRVFVFVFVLVFGRVFSLHSIVCKRGPGATRLVPPLPCQARDQVIAVAATCSYQLHLDPPANAIARYNSQKIENGKIQKYKKNEALSAVSDEQVSCCAENIGNTGKLHQCIVNRLTYQEGQHRAKCVSRMAVVLFFLVIFEMVGLLMVLTC